MAVRCPCLVCHTWRWCQWLALEVVVIVYAAIQACWPAWARVPIVIQCGDTAFRRSTAAALRRAFRDTQRAVGSLPPLPLHLRVLAATGTPPTFADLGQALVVYQVRELPDGPRAVITLAATAAGRLLTADQLVVALAAALDALASWTPDDPAVWMLPAAPMPVAARLAHDLPRWSAIRSSGSVPPPPSPPAPMPRPPHDPAADRPPDDPLGLGGR